MGAIRLSAEAKGFELQPLSAHVRRYACGCAAAMGRTAQLATRTAYPSRGCFSELADDQRSARVRTLKRAVAEFQMQFPTADEQVSIDSGSAVAHVFRDQVEGQLVERASRQFPRHHTAFIHRGMRIAIGCVSRNVRTARSISWSSWSSQYGSSRSALSTSSVSIGMKKYCLPTGGAGSRSGGGTSRRLTPRPVRT